MAFPGPNNFFGDAFFKQYMITGTHIALYFITVYSKTCLNRPLKIDKIKILMTNGSSMKVESIAECIVNQFCVFLRVAVLDRFYCTTLDMLDFIWIVNKTF